MAKVITGKCRLSYVNIKSPKGFEGQEPKYSVCVLVPKTDKKTVSAIKAAIEEVKRDPAAVSSWGGKVPSKLSTPWRDGDEEDDRGDEFRGHYFFNATSKRKPGVVDRDRDEILDLDEVYSGCYGRVSVNFYPYAVSGNKGIAAGLNNIQKLSEGERLGGGYSSPEDDFDDDFEDDEDLY